MQCKHHPERKADFFCATCNIPLCEDCGEEIRPGVYSCFQCSMLQSVSQAGSTLADRQKRAAERRAKKSWGPFQYFLVVSGFLLAVMWGVVLFGDQPSPSTAGDLPKSGRVLLFMVDGALKRYAHYEGNRYPEKLSELVPKYLHFEKSDLPQLGRLSYRLDPPSGYRLSLANLEKDRMEIVLSPKGIEYRHPTGEAAK